MEELLVKLLVRILAPHGKKDVATDKLVDHFAVSREALKQIYEERSQKDNNVLKSNPPPSLSVTKN